MSYFRQRAAFYPQQRAAINRQAVASLGIVGLILGNLMNNGAGDALTGRRLTTTRTEVIPALIDSSPGGVAVLPVNRASRLGTFASTSEGFYTANRLDWPDWQLAAPMSFFAYWYLTAYAGSSNADMGYNSGSDGYGLYEQFGVGNRAYNAGGITIAPGAVWPLNQLIMSVLTYDGGTLLGYLNGVADGSASGGGALSYGAFSRLYAGHQPDGHSLVGGVYYMGICKGLLAPAQIRALTANPWSIFAPVQRVVPFAKEVITVAAPISRFVQQAVNRASTY